MDSIVSVIKGIVHGALESRLSEKSQEKNGSSQEELLLCMGMQRVKRKKNKMMSVKSMYWIGFCWLDINLIVSGKRESRLKNYLHQTGL